jgi:peptide/nickel transport system permease protein
MSSLAKLVLIRLGYGAVTLVVVSLLIFLGVEALPGDLAEAVLGQSATPETVAAFRERLGLDEPPVQRYLAWISGMAQGDLGTSLASGRPIADLLSSRLWNTFFLAATAAILSIPLAILLGVVSALYRDRLADRALSIAGLSAVSVPEFLIAYILIAVFSVQLGLFPSLVNLHDDMGLWERVNSIILPAISLMLVSMAHMMRTTRAAILNVMASPYIEMARLKGIRRVRIVAHHAMPNSLSPIINVVILNLAYLVVGAVIVEVVFAYPGMGQLLVDSVSKRDLPVVQATCMIFAMTYVVLNLLADVMAILANPRLRHPK